jgi:hypothetical protein
MCSTALPEGFYGYIARFPSDHLALLAVALLAPIVVLLFAEMGRYTHRQRLRQCNHHAGT